MTTELKTALAQPFRSEELKFYPAAISKTTPKKGKVAGYADTRAYMDRLDEVMGPGNWSTSFRCIDPADKAVECTLALRIDGDWVSKADVGYPNEAKDADNPEKEPWKAAYSDSLKRACVQHGIGRYLYHLEFAQDWIEVDDFNKFKTPPRLKGTTAPVQQQTPAAATADPVTPSRKTFWDVTREMGFADDAVTSVSQSLFNNREPRQLGTEERKRLVLELEDRKRREPVPA